MDSTKLAGPTKYASKNPSVVIINNWSNGDGTSIRTDAMPSSVYRAYADSLIFHSRLHPGPSSQGLDHAKYVILRIALLMRLLMTLRVQSSSSSATTTRRASLASRPAAPKPGSAASEVSKDLNSYIQEVKYVLGKKQESSCNLLLLVDVRLDDLNWTSSCCIAVTIYEYNHYLSHLELHA
jgi:hypothetical protein